MDTLLKREEIESKKVATNVMNKIMSVSNDDLKVKYSMLVPKYSSLISLFTR